MALNPYSPQSQQFYRMLAGRPQQNQPPVQNAYTPQAQQFYKMLSARQPPPLHIPAPAEIGFQQQRQAANEQYRSQLVGNDYERANTAASYVNQLRDLNTGYDKSRAEIPYSYNRRGLLGGGIYRQGLQDFSQQRLRATGDLNAQRAQQLGSFDLVRQQIEAQRAQALAQIEAQRQALMASVAPGTIQ